MPPQGTSRISWGYRIAAAGATLLSWLMPVIFAGCFVPIPGLTVTNCDSAFSPQWMAILAFFTAMGFVLAYIAITGRSPVGAKLTAYLTRRWSGP